MRPLGKFFRDRTGPWVLAGKGPSFALRGERLVGLRVLGLNHVCLRHECELTHFTDLDAFLQCAPAVDGQASAVVLPWFPHVRNKPGKRTLEELCGELDVLNRLAYRGRLYTYNSTLARHRRVGVSTHKTRFFSAVVALDILATHGAGPVYTIGVDGGAAYAPEFAADTLLANGRSSFDAQFAEMKKTAEKYRIAVTPLLETAQ